MRDSLPTFICNPHFKFNKSKVVQRCLFSYRQRYSSSQWSKCCGLTRRSHNATTLTLTLNHFRFVFYRNIPTSKKVFISKRHQNHDTKKEQVFGFALFHSVIDSKFSRHFFNQSQVKPKLIVARACTFSRALCRLRVITSSFDWFTGLSSSFLIGQSNYFGFGFTTLD